MKRKNSLLMAALLGLSAHAVAEDPDPRGFNVVVIDETDRGAAKGVLARYGIASRVLPLSKGAHAAALREAMGDANVRMRLVMPTGCPAAASTREACANVRRIKDVDLPDVIRETRHSTLLVLWPEAAYFPKEQRYVAYLDVDVFEKGKVVSDPLYLGYRDGKCDADCVTTAFEASAKELAAMVRYVVEMGPAARTRVAPTAWQVKPAVATVSKWANTCATEVGSYHVVREYGERLWVNEPGERKLLSVAWRGCNIL
ncbi:MAG TPA: hypothetical protein VFO35_23205 [Steroidobacteraceae bacterium]|nr:hypothetical protein [Steroidobacteraceae bacterium]